MKKGAVNFKLTLKYLSNIHNKESTLENTSRSFYADKTDVENRKVVYCVLQ